MKKKSVLVTGGAGYIGSVLCDLLLRSGYRVTLVDRFFFGRKPISHIKDHPNLSIVKRDLRDTEKIAPLLKRGMSVIHLGSLSNDPSCDLDPEWSVQINHEATVRLADAAQRAGCGRFVFASSCSVYGHGSEKALTETSGCNPVSLYAQLKLKSEAEILKRNGGSFCPVIMRQATIYGLSPRMRFDLAINLMTMHAVTRGKIFVLGGGNQWRPFLHVRDAAEVYKKALEAGEQKVRGQIFNVGSNRHNFRIIDLARKVEGVIGGVEVEVAPEDADRRDYNVDFSKIHKALGFRPYNIVTAIREIAVFVRRAPKKDYDTGEFFNMKMLSEYAQKAALKGGEPVRSSVLAFDETPSPHPARLQPLGRPSKRRGGFFDFVRAGEGFDLFMRACGIKRGDEVITGSVCESWLLERLAKYGLNIRPVKDGGAFALAPDGVKKAITKKTRIIFLSEFDMTLKLKVRATTVLVTSTPPPGNPSGRADAPDAVFWKTWDVPRAASAPAARFFVNKASIKAALKRTISQREKDWLETPVAGELISQALDRAAENHNEFREKLEKIKKCVTLTCIKGNGGVSVLAIHGRFGLLFDTPGDAKKFTRYSKAEGLECAHLPPGFVVVPAESKEDRNAWHHRSVFLPVNTAMTEKDVGDVIRLLEKLL